MVLYVRPGRLPVSCYTNRPQWYTPCSATAVHLPLLPTCCSVSAATQLPCAHEHVCTPACWASNGQALTHGPQPASALCPSHRLLDCLRPARKKGLVRTRSRVIPAAEAGKLLCLHGYHARLIICRFLWHGALDAEMRASCSLQEARPTGHRPDF